MDLSGKTAIVTGAASGIGLGIATALAEAGANVVMADIQKDAVEQAAHGVLSALAPDVSTSLDEVHALTQAVARIWRAIAVFRMCCQRRVAAGTS